MPRPIEAPVQLVLSEWQVAEPATHPALRGVFTDATPGRLARVEAVDRAGRLGIGDVRRGMRIETSSWVGRIDLAGLELHVEPKLGRLRLPRLLRYAYRLGDLETFLPTRTPVGGLGFHDLLAAQLLGEVEAIAGRGLAARYTPQHEDLASPRGRVDMAALARRGGVRETALPCRYHPRLADWRLNRIVRAGLELAAGVTSDRELALGLRRLAGRLAERVGATRLDAAAVAEAERALTRLTSPYRPALTLVRLLHQSRGAATGEAGIPTPGFLFDMNAFWQACVGRFLRRNLPASSGQIEDERRLPKLLRYAAGANPRGRRPPAPRPDFALVRDGRARLFLDAKYRDVWSLGCPPGWLYQLAVYGVAARERTAVMLYPTEDPSAREERIELVDPGRADSAATVVLRPVLLQRLEELVTARPGHARPGAAAVYAASLVRSAGEKVSPLRAA